MATTARAAVVPHHSAPASGTRACASGPMVGPFVSARFWSNRSPTPSVVRCPRAAASRSAFPGPPKRTDISTSQAAHPLASPAPSHTSARLDDRRNSRTYSATTTTLSVAPHWISSVCPSTSVSPPLGASTRTDGG